jgi:hypothetical protein
MSFSVEFVGQILVRAVPINPILPFFCPAKLLPAIVLLRASFDAKASGEVQQAPSCRSVPNCAETKVGRS